MGLAVKIVVGIIRRSDHLPAALLGKDVLTTVGFAGSVGRALAARVSELAMMTREERHLNADLAVLGVDDAHDSLEAGNEVVSPNANIATIEGSAHNLHRRNAALGSHRRSLLNDATEAAMGIVSIVAHDNVIHLTVLISGKLCS